MAGIVEGAVVRSSKLTNNETRELINALNGIIGVESVSLITDEVLVDKDGSEITRRSQSVCDAERNEDIKGDNKHC